jgi:sulfur carrier protein ThiS
MPVIVIPPLMRTLTGGEARVQVAGRTVYEALQALEVRFPGVWARLCADDREGEGHRLAPDLAVVVDGQLSRRGLRHPLEDKAEVRFVTAIEGG